MSNGRNTEQEAAWQAVRQVVLERDRHRCRDCPESVARRDLDVHHLVRRADGGHDEASNCITLCDGCHAVRHPRLQVKLSGRMMRRWALRLAGWLDRTGQLPGEIRALNAGLELFGVDTFREGQLDAVLGALRGESLLVIRPTGAGKSLCFQLPAVLKGQPATLVLSPLKTLMVDQVNGLQDRKLPATFINSDISRQEKERRYALLENGALSLIYVAPERFNPGRVPAAEIARLTKRRPNFLVVDEAHLVDRWGDDFRTDYSRIADIRHQLGDPPVLAFTATAGVRTQERIKASLGIPDARTLVSGVDRPNIELIRLPEPSDVKRASIVAALIANLPAGRAMVFVPTKNVGVKVRAALAAAGCDVPLYHSKLPTDEKDHLQGRFTGTLDPPLHALITTSAFSMGVDISDVRVVVNWQHPAAVEDYLQEFGRGGRDGQPALSLLFTDGGRERGLLEWMADKTAEQVVLDKKRTAAQAQDTLRGRRERINEMSELSRQNGRCFREALVETLAGPPVQSARTLAERVLNFVVASRTRERAGGACCDVCNPEVAQRLRAGTYAPGGRTSSTALVMTRIAGDLVGRRRRGRSSIRRRLLGLTLGVLTLYGTAVLLLSGATDDDPETVAHAAFERYTRGFANEGEFEVTSVATKDGPLRACGRHVRNGRADPGRYTQCLLIDPDKPVGTQVIGGFKTMPNRGRYDCYGAAKTSDYCD